jgi:hypothetical protein
MLKLEEFNKSKSISELVNKFFESRQVAHNAHLATKSFSQHKALQGYYKDILDLTDDFVETYQGQYGILSGYENIKTNKVNDIVEYLEDCSKIFLAGHIAIEKKDSHLHNILDEICAATFRTLYKLKFLK